MKKIEALILTVIWIFTGCVGDIPATPDNTAVYSENPDFEVHFIDVGQADASLVICGEETMLIDGGNADDSSVIVSYLKKQGIDYLDYVICTHAHEDHVGGLSGALSATEAGTVYAPRTEADSKAYRNFKKKTEQQGLEITNPVCGEIFKLGDATVQVVGPVTEETDNLNDTSIVLKVTYGETDVLFTGDAEYDEEQDILDAGYDISAEVLKVGHHGSSTSTSYKFLREVMPEYGIISSEKDNSYGHPHDEVLSRLRDAGVTVYRTDMQGDVVMYSDGKNINFKTGKNADIKTNPTEKPSGEAVYIGNKNSKKFHDTGCGESVKEENREYFYNRSEAVEAGYKPCGTCKP